jgi:hypothetical protein
MAVARAPRIPGHTIVPMHAAERPSKHYAGTPMMPDGRVGEIGIPWRSRVHPRSAPILLPIRVGHIMQVRAERTKSALR